jgi:hypothetical protein
MLRRRPQHSGRARTLGVDYDDVVQTVERDGMNRFRRELERAHRSGGKFLTAAGGGDDRADRAAADTATESER